MIAPPERANGPSSGQVNRAPIARVHTAPADGSDMERVWSREEVARFVVGRKVFLRDEFAGTAPTPAWMDDVAYERGLEDSTAYLRSAHSDDRNPVVDSWLGCFEHPGEFVTLPVRRRIDGTWCHTELTWLNLLDVPGVGFVLGLETIHDGPPIVDDDEVTDPGITSATNWMILTMAESGAIVHARGKVHETLGYHPDELLGRSPTDFLHPDGAADSIAMWFDLRSEPGATRVTRRRWIHRDGSEIWLESSYLNEPDPYGAVQVVALDISERVAQETELRRQRLELEALNERMRSLLDDFRVLADQVPAAVFRCDVGGVVDFHNARWADLVAGRPGARRLHDLIADDDHGRLDAALDELRSAEQLEQRTLEVTAPDGTVWEVLLRALAEQLRGQRTIAGSLDDVTATVRLRDEARRDPLTGLVNRAGLEEIVRRQLDADAAGALVVFIDLDGFKAVNDSHGHDAGDIVLAEVAQRLEAAVRPEDAVGRFGGDEFVVVCGEVADAAAAQSVLDRLSASLGHVVEFPGGSWLPRASLGAARPHGGESLASLLRRADQEMFRVKRRRQQADADR